MSPDAAVRASKNVIELSLVELRPGQLREVRWRALPVFVLKRSADMLRAMQAAAPVRELRDPESKKPQQPAYARNWHRSIDPEYAVLIGVCTKCGCIPQPIVDRLPDLLPGDYVCPCCASQYDAAGRAFAGPAQYNLPVPPYAATKQTLWIGKNNLDVLFSLESIERL